MTIIADDLFAGAGGWDLGAAEHGIEARGVENMPEARATRDAAGLVTIHDDVWTFRPEYRLEHATPADHVTGAPAVRIVLVATGLIASPPCQTFSTAGSGSGRKALNDVLALLPQVATMSLPALKEAGKALGDDRTALVLTPLWFALHHPYRWLAWEQVPTVLPVWEACAEVLREHGFNVWTGNLYAVQYGAPQDRKRAFLLASKDREVAPPTPTHSRFYPRDPGRVDPGVERWVTMAEALNGFGLTSRPSPTITGGGTETGGAEPIAKLARYADRPDFAPRSRGGPRAIRESDQPAATVAGNSDRARWLESNYSGPVREDGTRDLATRQMDEPAPTVTSKPHKWVLRASNLANASVRCEDEPAPTVMFGRAACDVRWYPQGETTPRVAESAETRSPASCRVTVAEAGILQTFPADHPWQGRRGKQYLQVGNAVPPVLAKVALGVVI